ncbi:MAG: menaquinone biosynthetic enzyme MqnA/MqnD family protein [Fimbriimonadales bacterium]
MPRYRIGCVPFLNAKPLVALFAGPEGRHLAEVEFAPPSRLADWVLDGRVDVALASSFFALSHPEFKVAPGVAIASQGKVRSVRLFSRRPFHEIESLALDSESMTSNHLARIILQEKYGILPECFTRDPVLEAMLAEADAAVLIGDAGMAADATGLEAMDLGGAWNELTGLPFVWAMWIGKQRLTPDLAGALISAKEFGMEHLEQIAKEESARLEWPFGLCFEYLTESIDFDLSHRHLEGFSRFATYCAAMGFTDSSALPEIVDEASVAPFTSSL